MALLRYNSHAIKYTLKVVCSSSPNSRHFHYLQKKLWTISNHFLVFSLHRLRQPLIYFPSLWICLFWTYHINGIIQYVAFCVWCLSLSVFWKFLCCSIFWCFLLPVNILLYRYTTFCSFISLVVSSLGYFHLGAVMNSTAVNICVQVLCGHHFYFSWMYTLEGNCWITW